MSLSQASFATTQWSLVAVARDGDATAAREALAELCRTYWYPLYVFIRRQGHTAEQSQDLTQEFFTRLLEHDALKSVAPAKGRFRSFLLAACKHFLANERDRERAQKRGGGRPLLSLDIPAAESRYHHEPVHNLTPERLFDRRWALTLLDAVFERLRTEFRQNDRDALFDQLKSVLSGDGSDLSYRRIAEALGMTEDAVKMAAHRLRRRYRDLLREEIARTLADPADVEGEIQDLFTLLGP